MALKSRDERTFERAEVRTRRRGAVLEDALLEAAWDELVEHGYDTLTYEAVAARAHTSRAVLYRRWPTKPDLALAAIRHTRADTLLPVPDAGSLRGDLIAVLRSANESRFRMAFFIWTRLGGYFAETGSGPADLRAAIMSGQPSRLDAVWDRALARGEVDPARVTPRVRRLPFDLFRDQLIMTLKPVPDEEIDEIVDQIVLPLVRPSAR